MRVTRGGSAHQGKCCGGDSSTSVARGPREECRPPPMCLTGALYVISNFLVATVKRCTGKNTRARTFKAASLPKWDQEEPAEHKNVMNRELLHKVYSDQFFFFFF